MRVNLDNIYSECANVTKGTDLLVKYGDETKKIYLSFVPSIAIDKVIWMMMTHAHFR